MRSLRFGDMDRLLEAYLRYGTDVWCRSLQVASDGYGRAGRHIIRGLLGPASAEDVGRELAMEGLNCVAEVAMVAPLAAEEAAARLSRPPKSLLGRFNTSIEGAVPNSHGRTFDIDGKPLLMPARFTD